MISKEEVQHIAKLARIELQEGEIERFQKDFSQILEYFNVLKEADTTAAEPMTHSVPLKNVFRKDDAQRTQLSIIQKILELLPDMKEGFAKVKSILH